MNRSGSDLVRILFIMILLSGKLALFVLANVNNNNKKMSTNRGDNWSQIVNWWVFVTCEPKSSQLKEPKTNYFSLCALNLFNTRVSQFELNY